MGMEVSNLISVQLSSTGIQETTTKLASLDRASGRVSVSMGGLVGTALKSIPAWYALRTAYLSVFKAFGDGIGYIVEADKGLAKAMAVSTNSTKEFRDALQQVGRQQMVATGKSAAEVYEAFYQLGTSGLDATTALEGMGVVLKTSVALMGDVTKTGRAIADIYNRFGDSITSATTPLEKFEQIGATITLLWEKNNFLLNEFTDSFKVFGATAKIANLSFDQTAALMASVNNLMVRGTSGGTGLSRSFIFMVQNVKKLNEFLKEQGVITRDVNLSQSNLLELWEKTAQAINKMGSNSASALKAMQEIFGTKSSQAIGAIAKSYELYVKNVELLANTNATERAKELTREFEIQQKTIAVQGAIFKNLKDIMIEGFAIALTDTNDFAAALTSINVVMERLIENAVALGVAFHAMFEGLKLPSVLLKLENLNAKLLALNEEGGVTYSTKRRHGFRGVPATETKENLTKQVVDILAEYTKTVEAAGLGGKDLVEQYVEKINSLLGKGGALSQKNFQTMREQLNKELEDFQNDVKSQGDDTGEEYAKSFKDGFQKELKKSILGEQDDFFGNMETLLRDHVAEAMSQGIADGLGNAFNNLGGVFAEIKGMFETPTTKMYDAIVAGCEKGAKLFSDAITQASSTASSFTQVPIGAAAGGGYNTGMGGVGAIASTAAATTTGSTSWLGKISSGISSIFGGGGTIGTGSGGAKQTLALALSAYGLSRGVGGQSILGSLGMGIAGLASASSLRNMLGGLGSLGAVINGTGGIGTAAGGLSGGLQFLGQAGQLSPLLGVLGILGGGLSAYSGFKSGNTMGGIGGILTASGAALSMTGIGSIIGIPLMIAGSIMSLFGGGKKTQTTVQTQEETFKVSSKIDITNKRLEIINRDLSAIRQTVETYILPSSAYFSTNTISEQFSIDSKRLLM